MTGIDISRNFVRYAREAEAARPLGIRYENASAVELPFESARFDFVVAFMSLMDISETERVLAEVFRVLRPRGFLYWSNSESRAPATRQYKSVPACKTRKSLRTSCTSWQESRSG
jgi:ubiquinone/menaquinone biosynthesis C-methylase UbiE